MRESGKIELSGHTIIAVMSELRAKNLDAPDEVHELPGVVEQLLELGDLTVGRTRAGVHVGEVELVDDDIRGSAVNAAARIMDRAEPDEILLSETTRTLAQASGLAFEGRGAHQLKGLPGEWTLYAYVPGGDPKDL